MKVLVISDTHGRIDHVRTILEQTIPYGVKAVLHCGDYVSDARLIQKFYPQVEVFGVYGNCDTGFGGEYDRVVEIEGVSIYMTHGHRYGVKWGEYDELAIDAAAHGVMAAVCGHSHQAYLGNVEGILVMNPGSITLPRDSQYPSYGMIEIKDEDIVQANVLQIMPNGTVVSHPLSHRFG